MNTTLETADAIRRFNRFYTRQIGALDEHLARTEFSLSESRILYELGSTPGLTSAELRQLLGLDAGYLSRIIAGFERKGLVSKSPSPSDARATVLRLTEQGSAVLASLEQAAREEVAGLLRDMPPARQQRLVQAMEQIQALLGERDGAYVLRPPQAGDMGRVVQQQAQLYTREYGWNSEFEAMVAEIVAKFLRESDSSAQRCWIAEKHGEIIGSVFVTRHDDTTAKLRMLYVDASARGLGIGQRLVEETLRFARDSGYTRIMLWTVSVLTEARRLYQKAGFQLVEEAPVHQFGKDLLSQTWVLEL
ncbi:helix-turn-helix domain-containing GNAT family N-acetyltransferase [Pseudomonas sp. GD04058]|uniref:bifunctional helix-turn-helix transcriptional regulator/GNAT family N-acetyltransferase n=1 Tax=Pseudomonas sp. GD04058 TaxID=2975429 RepID=UPI002447A450|nr:helix-turn-helix domain-containing GNAT family N-acetyltransferase [Pseudomonas sp. GD04058]MDG9883772.1 helix-turn-helix domain-containing GNAT family N-acetyltransferase [Pseudomonas sp. GD04058]